MRMTTITPNGAIDLSKDELQALGVEVGEQVIIDVKAGILTVVPMLELDAGAGKTQK